MVLASFEDDASMGGLIGLLNFIGIETTVIQADEAPARQIPRWVRELNKSARYFVLVNKEDIAEALEFCLEMNLGSGDFATNASPESN